jgi:hypothetical protein
VLRDQGSAAPTSVFVLLREDGTLAGGIARDPYEPPNTQPSSEVVEYIRKRDLLRYLRQQGFEMLALDIERGFA